MNEFAYTKISDTPGAGAVLPDAGDSVPIYAVADVTGAIRGLLESSLPYVRVHGEISNLSRPRSGHLYLSLVDDDLDAGESRFGVPQLPCVIWRSTSSRLRFNVKNGQRVIASGRVTAYEPRGSYQLVVESMRPAGLGELQRLFEELKARLQKDGLFDPERKQPLPFLPRIVGLVTSPSGAAIQDVLRGLRRRFPDVGVRVVAARMQGEGSATEVVRAIDLLSRTREVDVIVVARGGGSIEDLWTFNEEPVARAIARSEVPLVSAIGHEVDFTIADFVADARAQTPTQAAELVVPDARDLAARLNGTARRLRHSVGVALERAEERWRNLARRPVFRTPQGILDVRRDQLLRLAGRLDAAVMSALQTRRSQLATQAARLDGLSPLKVLGRGYAVVQDKQGGVVHDAGNVTPRQPLELILRRGRLECEVTRVHAETWKPYQERANSQEQENHGQAKES